MRDGVWSRPLPERLLDLEFRGNQVRPRYLGARDARWVDDLVQLVRSLETRARREVEQELQRRAPTRRRTRWLALTHLLQGLCGHEIVAAAQPQLLRSALFQEAAAMYRCAPTGVLHSALQSGSSAPRAAAAAGTMDGPDEPAAIITRVASRLQLTATELDRSLYADLPSERRLGALPDVEPSSIIAGYNMALAQGLLWRSQWLHVRVEQQLATVLRHARRQRLLCQVERDPGGGPSAAWHITLSGPLALFHHTTRYGRAMASWLPVLVRAPGWQLRAACRLTRGGLRQLEASHRDPISAVEAAPLRLYDSALEQRFAQGVERLARDRFQVLREADPLQIGGQVACPDFTLVDRRTGERIGVELVGFWTAEYLAHKLALLRRVPGRWVVCIDDSLAAGREQQLPEGPLFRFRRRVDVPAFLEFIERHRKGLSGGYSIS